MTHPPAPPRLHQSMAIFLRRILYGLRGGFLVRPMLIAVVLGAAGGLLSTLEQQHAWLDGWVPAAFFPTRADPQVAQVILAGIAASIMTVVSIVFAILLMTLTLASSQFSPRILVSFVRDRTTQWTLGLFLGTFAFCLAALPAARSQPTPFAPVASVAGGMLLAMLCVFWLIFFIQHISQAISVNHIVDRIARETEGVIDETMPQLRVRAYRVGGPALDWRGGETTLLSLSSGYIRYVDSRRLVTIARMARLQIRVRRRVGHFVPEGSVLLVVNHGERLGALVAAELLSAFDIGPARTLQQDVEFGVLQIVDIALKAISPAVNDPSTAITCLDQLSRILIRWVGRQANEAALLDPPHGLRVSLPTIDFDGLLDTAVEQIRHYAKGDLAVSARLLRVLGDVAASTGDEVMREILRARGERVVAGCRSRLEAADLVMLEARLGEIG